MTRRPTSLTAPAPLRIFAAFAPLLLLSLSGNAQAPLQLYNGSSLLGWHAQGQWTGGGGILASAANGERSILTAVPFADYNLFFDYNESTALNARLRLAAPQTGAGGSYVDLDGSGTSRAGIGGLEGAAKSRVPTFPSGTWHHLQVVSAHGQLSVTLDGQPSGSGAAPASSGYVGFEVNGSGTFQVRNVHITLNNLSPAFNGSDLSTWKAVAQTPKSKGGVGHDVAKTFTFGLGGGSTKPHAAKWNVQGGAIHGEDGPGGLEYATPIEDGILQISATLKGSNKPDHFTSISLRNPPGQLDGGYAVGVGPFAGSILGRAKYPQGGNGAVETVIIAGRTIAIWVGSTLATVETDSRPESAHVAQGAHSGSGSATLVLPGDVQLDVRSISITPLAGGVGGGVRPISIASATPSAAGGTESAPASAAGAAAGGGGGGGGNNAMASALLQQQQQAQQQQNADRQSKQRVASLMAAALSTSDPVQQMNLYNQVVQIDPSNAPAVQGYKDAQTKVQNAQSAQDQQQAQQVNQQHDALTRDQQINGSLVKAQSAFLAGHIAEAAAALTVAERLAPDNPMVRDLHNRINATSSLHSRIFYLAGGGSLVALFAALALWFRRKRQQRFPMLEITGGLDAGEQFALDKDVIRIGAVAQDAGQKNDIVVPDVDRVISRFHCEIAKKDGLLYITDLRSSNGTRVEGTPLVPGQPTLLRKGNRILLADSVELRLGYGRRAKPRA